MTILLTPEVTSHHLRRVPCIACPELAADIRKQMGHTMRQRKGDWRCYFFTDQVTFVLPAGENFNQNYCNFEHLVNWTISFLTLQLSDMMNISSVINSNMLNLYPPCHLIKISSIAVKTLQSVQFMYIVRQTMK